MTGQNHGQRGKWLRAGLIVCVAIAAHALGATSAQAAPIGASAKSDTVLAGFTAQHYPVFFRVSNDGKTLVNDGIALSMSCTSGATVVWPDAFARVPIHANGRLHAAFAGPTILNSGTSYQATDTLTARLSPKLSQLTGTWTLAVHFGFSDGTSDQCDSGPVTFTATR
jgi:hypothetical protein